MLLRLGFKPILRRIDEEACWRVRISDFSVSLPASVIVAQIFNLPSPTLQSAELRRAGISDSAEAQQITNLRYNRASAEESEMRTARHPKEFR